MAEECGSGTQGGPGLGPMAKSHGHIQKYKHIRIQFLKHNARDIQAHNVQIPNVTSLILHDFTNFAAVNYKFTGPTAQGVLDKKQLSYLVPEYLGLGALSFR